MRKYDLYDLIPDADYEYTHNGIWLGDFPIMHTAETSVMHDYVDVVTKNGGDILEIGFGMGISADHIQSKDITSHTIIERNKKHYNKALEWAESRPNVQVFLGDWFDVLPPISKKYDGIFHDTFHDNNEEMFIQMCTPNANKNCILSQFYFGVNNNLRGNSNVKTVNLSEDGKKYFNNDIYQIVYTTFINGFWSANGVDTVNYSTAIYVPEK